MDCVREVYPQKSTEDIIKALEKAAWSANCACQILIDDHKPIGQLIDEVDEATIDATSDLLVTDDDIPLSSAFRSMPLQSATLKEIVHYYSNQVIDVQMT